jgi:hypothetical protein
MKQSYRLSVELRLKLLVFRIEYFCDKTSGELRFRQFWGYKIKFNVKEKYFRPWQTTQKFEFIRAGDSVIGIPNDAVQ